MAEPSVDFVLGKKADERGGNASGDASGLDSGVLRAAPSSEVSNPVKTGGAGRFAKTEVGCFLRNDGSSGNLKTGIGGIVSSESVGVLELSRLAILASSSLILVMCACSAVFNFSISASFSLISSSNRFSSLRSLPISRLFHHCDYQDGPDMRAGRRRIVLKYGSSKLKCRWIWMMLYLSLGRYRKDKYVLVDSVCRLPPDCVMSENKSGKCHSANHKVDYQT